MASFTKAIRRGIGQACGLLMSLLAFMFAACRPVAPVSVGRQQTAASPSETEPLRFKDRAQEAGLTYRWKIAGKRPLTILQTIGNGCAFLDYDGDGNLDILLVGQPCALYRGDGHGHFTDVSVQTGIAALKGDFRGCAVGDFDNDGWPDLYLSGYRTGILLHNESGGKQGRVFRDVTRQAGIPVQSWGSSAAFSELDSDGRLALWVGNYVAFGPHTGPPLCDFNGIASACNPKAYAPLAGRLYAAKSGRSGAIPRFQDVTQARGLNAASGKALGAAWADFDGSGRQSLAVANDGRPGDLMQNRGKRFDNIGVEAGTAYDRDGQPHAGMGIDWGDYDNDGRLDLIVTTYQRETKTVYHNEGRQFTERAADLGLTSASLSCVAFGVKWCDFDNDGWLDLIMASGHVQDNIAAIDRGSAYRQPTLLFHNQVGSSFVEQSGMAGADLKRPIVGRGLAVGDYDNDGRMDVLIVDSEGTPLLLHNETPHVGHWLECQLRGTRSNRMGLGALLTLQANGKKYLRRCATDGSYLSASDARVHFGLGDTTSADLTVRWPSGRQERFRVATVDRVMALTEGQGTPVSVR